MRFFIFCFCLLFLLNFDSKSATCTLTASTNWTVAASWSCGHVPTGADNIVIPSGYTVTITTSVDLFGGSLTQMNIAGGLFFSGNTSTLKLPTTATVTLSSTGVIYTDVNNNSQKFKIGNNTIWTSNEGTVTGPSTATSTSGALPIELIDFTAKCVNNGIELNWSTASEEDNDYFLLEKSLNGSEWLQIAKVAGQGTSGIVNKYIHIDYSDDKQLVYFRLSQVDKNGAKEVFKAIDVNCKNVKDQIVLYPNPSSSEVNIFWM